MLLLHNHSFVDCLNGIAFVAQPIAHQANNTKCASPKLTHRLERNKFVVLLANLSGHRVQWSRLLLLSLLILGIFECLVCRCCYFAGLIVFSEVQVLHSSDQPHERLLVDARKLTVSDGSNSGRARFVSEQSHFSEILAFHSLSQLAPNTVHYNHSAFDDNVEIISLFTNSHGNLVCPSMIWF